MKKKDHKTVDIGSTEQGANQAPAVVDAETAQSAAGTAGRAAGEKPRQPDSKGAPAPDELQELRRKAAEYDTLLDTVKRVKADFDNYQKRVQRDQEEQRKFSAQSVLCDFLSVLDNLERALAACKTAKTCAEVAVGVAAIRNELLAILERHDVKPMESCGKCFDPSCQEAVCCEETDAVPDSTVMEEFRKGYKLHERVLRPAQVKVAKRKAEPPETPDGPAS